jgi:ribosomal protein L24E
MGVRKMTRVCEKCGKQLEEGTGLMGALENLKPKCEFDLCKICQRRFEVHKLQFFDKVG